MVIKVKPDVKWFSMVFCYLMFWGAFAAYNQRHGFGTTHGDERFIQFKPMGKFMDPMGKGPVTERDFHVSKMVLWQWTTFAATQNPTPTKIPKVRLQI